MATEQKPCCACGKRAAINEGLCFWCTLEYAKHQEDFDNLNDPPDRGPIVQESMPAQNHFSGGPWVRGLTEENKTCWV